MQKPMSPIKKRFKKWNTVSCLTNYERNKHKKLKSMKRKIWKPPPPPWEPLPSGGSTYKPGWSQDHPDLQKNVDIHLPKNVIC